MSGMDGRPIVAGIDGSDSARRAAMWAAAQAARRNVEMRLVHVVSTPVCTFAGGFVPPPEFFSGLESQAWDLLNAVRVELLGRYAGLTLTTHLRVGQPAGVLIEESRSSALVVLGADARDETRRPFLGSTAISLAAHGHCPTAVIRGRGDDQEVPDSGPVVVGVDGSAPSEAAVAIAFDEASARSAELIAVHATGTATSEPKYSHARHFTVDWVRSEEAQREILAERLVGWREKYPDVSVRQVLTAERPARALLGYGPIAQLIVVGSRGRGGFAGALLGSVSQKLIHHAPCPLMVAGPEASG